MEPRKCSGCLSSGRSLIVLLSVLMSYASCGGSRVSSRRYLTVGLWVISASRRPVCRDGHCIATVMAVFVRLAISCPLP